MGEVEISGKAVGPYTIISPLSLNDCYYYRAVAYLTGEDGKRAGGPFIETLSVPFFLEDGTGSVMVDARGAEADLPCTYKRLAHGYAESDALRHFLARRAIPESATVQLVEYAILPGDPLFVLGTLRENSPDNHSRPATTGADFLSPEAAALERQMMLEYMHAVLPGEARAGTESTGQLKDFNLDPPVVLGKGANEEPFILSRRSRREVVAALAAKSALYIWGGSALALASLAYLVVHLANP
jgi:hypothetical protein